MKGMDEHAVGHHGPDTGSPVVCLEVRRPVDGGAAGGDLVVHEEHGGVPDPYFGGQDSFELVADIMRDGCEGILRELGKIS